MAGLAGRAGRTAALLAAGVGSLCLDAAEPAPVVASASFSGGECQLRAVSISQNSSPLGRKRFSVNMEFQFETLPRKADGSSPPLPQGFYLNNDQSPLVAAHAVAGKNLAKTPHSGSAQGNTGVVVINNLEVGEVRQRLQDIEIEVAVVRVTEWDTQSFQAALGRSDFFKYGPFELRAVAEGRQLKVDAMPYPQFRADHEAYRVRMPLAFLNPAYAMQELKLVDTAGRSPTSTGSTVPGSGAVSSTFTGWRVANPGTESPAVASDGIDYPVTLTVRLPKRFETERVKFRFEEIILPAPAAAGR